MCIQGVISTHAKRTSNASSMIIQCNLNVCLVQPQCYSLCHIHLSRNAISSATQVRVLVQLQCFSSATLTVTPNVTPSTTILITLQTLFDFVQKDQEVKLVKGSVTDCELPLFWFSLYVLVFSTQSRNTLIYMCVYECVCVCVYIYPCNHLSIRVSI